MKKSLSEKLEAARELNGYYASRHGDPYGAFTIQGPCGEKLRILAVDAHEESVWEHVSVSTSRRVPNWQEMCFVKNLFWSEDEWVVQFHPAKVDYVNMHPFTLHLWRTVGFPTPPSNLVGIKGP